jgi:hypothetical protein
MNAHTPQNVIYVATTSDIEIEKAMNIRITGAGDLLSSLDLFFNIARLHSDYAVSKEEFLKADRTDSDGGYTSILSAIFVDFAGKPVPVNSGIALWDPDSDRRLFVVILEPGVNILVYDKLRKDERNLQAVLLSAAEFDVGGLLGMKSRWEESNIHDLLNCARLFGFEFDRNSNCVVVPTKRATNWFKSYRNKLIPQPEMIKVE